MIKDIKAKNDAVQPSDRMMAKLHADFPQCFTNEGKFDLENFMYVVKKKDGSKELNIVVETKGVEGKSSLRKEEQVRIDCATKFFEQLQLDGYEVNFQTQINNKTMTQIVKELIE